MSVKFSASVNLVKNPESQVKAFATLYIEDDSGFKMALNGYAVRTGQFGEWVTVPQTKASKAEEDGTFKYYNNNRFLEEVPEDAKRGPFETAAVEAIMKAYKEAAGGAARGSAAEANTKQPKRKTDQNSAANW